MTTDERLAKLRERYRGKWYVYRTLTGHGGNRFRAACGDGPDAIAISFGTVAALAEALAKLEGKCPKCSRDLSCMVCNWCASHGMEKEGK